MTRDGNCPVTPLLLMLQGRWKSQLMYEMCIHDTVRFGQLKKALAGITNTMLTKALRELEEDGLISRRQFNEIPPHVEYSLTEMGRDLLPVFYAIMNWGFKHEEELYAMSKKETGDGSLSPDSTEVVSKLSKKGTENRPPSPSEGGDGR